MDWIDQFMEYTDGLPSPEVFRLWSAIGAVSGALERRVWVRTARSALYPNMFILLVAPPAVGKSQAISPVGELWYATKKFHVAPDNVTKASLIDAIDAAERKIVLKDGKGVLDYHSLLVPASEFGVLVPSHDLEFLNTLNHIYDNPRCYRENRRSLSKQIDISQPQITILGGTQPGYLASLLPEEAWSMGFTSRIIMVYAGQGPVVSLFNGIEPRQELYASMLKGMEHMAKLHGECVWDKDAQANIEAWAQERCPPIPEHSKLLHYNGRRILHALKLCMVSAVARSGELNIKLCDVQRARDWLLHAEQLMPDIFREMTQRSDAQVIQELHFFLWRIWVKDQRPIHESRLIHFLSARVPSEKILRVMEVAERSNVICRPAGVTNLYIPRPTHEHGLE